MNTRAGCSPETRFCNLEVTGEISGYKHHYSGHRYFYLKDASARVQCVMFRQYAMGLEFAPEDGMKVTLTASASIFRGTVRFSSTSPPCARVDWATSMRDLSA